MKSSVGGFLRVHETTIDVVKSEENASHDRINHEWYQVQVA